MSRTRVRANKPDWFLIILFVAITLFGWLNVYSTSRGEDESFNLSLTTLYGKQLLWLGISVVAGFGLLLFDGKFFPAFAYLIYAMSLVLLVAVLFVGTEVYGSKSWFVISDALRFQPSEFAKYATALALAKFMGNKEFSFSGQLGENILGIIPRQALGVLLLYAVPGVLILLENDTGSTIAFAALALAFYREGMHGGFFLAAVLAAILFFLSIVVPVVVLIGILAAIGGLSATYFFYTRQHKVGIFVIFLTSLFAAYVTTTDYIFHQVLKPHQQARVNVLLGLEKDLRGAGYNVNQSKIAIGSGGLTGKGFLEGTQTKYRFVPKQTTDFIFSAVGEEWGFLGASLLIFLYSALLIKIVLNAERQRTRFSRVYGYCVFSILFAHFALNIGMALGLAPTIGIPLPLFSYGGSSLFSFTVMLFTFIKLDAERSEILG
ncbi:MAG: rod shape-determining protein RodA [Flavobacteriales bacterium]|nr:rod shape-determining protein RodA [Flavobacteriales bacterium]MDW8410564.1 rod shape-determining protein RodA [Flavobacteriales bacterium]